MDAVYLDNASTTRVSDEVVQAMAEAMTLDYGNPSSAHRLGGAAARRLERAGEQVAAAIGAEARDVYFTSGGTEANALGTLGVAGRLGGFAPHPARPDDPPRRGRHVVVSGLEHPSVLDGARRLAE